MMCLKRVINHDSTGTAVLVWESLVGVSYLSSPPHVPCAAMVIHIYTCVGPLCGSSLKPRTLPAQGKRALPHLLAQAPLACPLLYKPCAPLPCFLPHSNAAPRAPRRSPLCTPVLPCRPLQLAQRTCIAGTTTRTTIYCRIMLQDIKPNARVPWAHAN